MSNYDLPSFAAMCAEEPRVLAYAKALKSLITPASVVLDIGAGTGLFTLLACAYGAKKVYAVEPSTGIQQARDLAYENNYHDRIEFYECTLEELPELDKADLIVADLRGRLPYYSGNLTTMQLAVNKYLKRDGQLLPAKDFLRAALCKSSGLYTNSISPWQLLDLPFHNKTFSKRLSNLFHPASVTAEAIGSAVIDCGMIDYRDIKTFNYQQILELQCQAECLYGFFLWFDCELTPQVFYSNGIEAKNKVYGSAFFPFLEPLKLKIGSSIRIDLSANFIDGDYVWSWKTLIKDPSGVWQSCFEQSTFKAALISKKVLANKVKS